jgi:TPR repeat protein
MIKKDSPSARILRLAATASTLALAACAPGGPFVLDAQEQLVVADYYHRHSDEKRAIEALERAAAIAPDEATRLRALKRIPALTGDASTKALSASALNALEQAALLGDHASVEKLATAQQDGGLTPGHLPELLPLYEKLAQQKSDKAALLLARLNVAEAVPGGEAAALEWWTLAGARGSAEAQRRLVIAHALRHDDAEAMAWARKAFPDEANDPSMRIARGFLGGDREFPADQALGLTWANKAVASGGDKSTAFGAGLARRLLLGTDGTARNLPEADRLLATLARRDPDLADKTRLSAASSLIKGDGVKRDMNLALALIDQSATSGSSRGQDFALSAALRLAAGRDGYPRDGAAANRLRALVPDAASREKIGAILEGRPNDPLYRQTSLSAARKAAESGKVDLAAKYFAESLQQNRAATLHGSQLLLASLAAAGADPAPVERQIEQVANAGDADAMLILAERETARAQTDPVHATLAKAWLQRAADGGNAEAQYKLGVALAQGTYGPADPPAARSMLLKAKASGNPQAGDAIERLGLP